MFERQAKEFSIHPRSSSSYNNGPTLHRTCECGQHLRGGECTACGKNNQSILQSNATPSYLRKQANNRYSPQEIGGTVPWIEPYPYQDKLDGSFGFSIPGRALLAPVECRQMGVPAFTDGSVTYFQSDQPSLRLAAHEAAHIAQHVSLTRDANLGAEGHASAVAQHVATGLPVQGLIGPHGSPISTGLRKYSEVPVASQTSIRWNAGMDLRVAQDGRMAVGQDSTMHSFWADSARITLSNSILSSRHSVIRLVQEPDTIRGPAPNGSGPRVLSKVLPENVANTTTGENMNIWADCGSSARDVMGVGGGTGTGYDRMTAVFRKRTRSGTRVRERETAASDPEGMKHELFNELLGGTGDEGLRRYMAMSPARRRQFDRRARINRFAVPNVGEGYTTSSGGSPVPGNTTWNFHWGGVVMLSGDDRVTLENYAVGDPSVQNTDWEFQMYGSARNAGQTFHEQHQATGQHGTAPTTMRVRER